MPADSRVRFGVVGIVAVSLFAALFARLWFLQVMTAPEYQVAAENNRIRVVQEEAPRGRIRDRNGTTLVDNRRTVVVTVDWQRYDGLDEADQNALLARLAPLLSGDRKPPQVVTVDQLRNQLADPRFSHFKPVPVATDVSEALEVYLAEHGEEFPTVRAERITVRNYHYGQLLAHVLGTVGAINEDEVKDFQNREKPYELDDEIGKTGIERALEARLRGVPGEVRYEVDARNRPIRRIGGRPPVAGDDVYLSVDINLQYQVEKSLAAQIKATKPPCDSRGCFQGPRAGSAVVLDPRNGQVLSMASYPTYRPADFVGGISTEEYNALVAKENLVPAENKAIAGQYAPGSTWKLFSAYAGLANHQIRPEDTVDDRGYYEIPGCTVGKCQKQNANRQQHGTVNMSSAITVSSDVYFYKLGDDIWRRKGEVGEDALGRTYQQWGFGASSGSGLVGESDGRVPTPAWKRAFAKELYPDDPKQAEANGAWYSGDNMNTAIGQGDVLVTPLQLANGYATFANGGTLYAPQFVLQVTKPYSASLVDAFEPKPVRTIPLPPEWRIPMLEGFKGVTVSGTAKDTFAGFPQDRMAVAGKTGTAQVNDKGDTSLFAAFAPADAPQYAAAAIVPEAGKGGDAAAPLIRRILEPLAQPYGLKGLSKAPPGGAFDVDAAIGEITAPPSDAGD